MRREFGTMRTMAVFAALLAPACAVALSGAAVVTDNVTARLVAENRGAVAGKSLWVALEFDIRDGWHTYWRNPGDSGQATQLTWSLPPGWKAGYAKHAVHLVELTAPPDLPAGRPVHLAARATWLVCADLCIPGSADLVLDLPVAASAAAAGADPDAAALFAAARGALARRAPGAVTAVGRGDSLVLVLGADWGAALGQIRSLAFFPYAEGAIDYAAPQTMTRSAERVELALKPGYKPPQDGPLRGLLLVGQAPPAGPIPLEVAAPFNAGGLHAAAKPRFAAAPSPAAASASPAAAKPGLAGLLLLAVLGGLVLNLMPCVFPVLSIKAIGLVEQAKRHPAAVRAKGVVFAAGVLASMLTLAGVLLALRAGGEQIGWGFQLQSPVFVTGMVYLLLAVGLNLSGVFEVGG